MTPKSDNAAGKSYVALTLRIFASVGLLALALRNANFTRIVELILHTAPLPLAAGLLLQIATRFAAAERTFAVTSALGFGVSRARSVMTLFITNFYSLFLPDAFAGGVGTAYQYGRLGIPWERTTGALLVSRLIEFLVFCAAGALMFITDPLSPGGDREKIIVITLLFGATLAAAASLRISSWVNRRGAAQASRDSLPGRLIVVCQLVMRATDREVLRSAFPAVIQVLLSALGFMAFGDAMGLEISLSAATWIMGLTYVVTLIPWSIAGIGVREFTFMQVLPLVGIPPDEALVFAMLLLATQLLCGAVGAVLCLRR